MWAPVGPIGPIGHLRQAGICVELSFILVGSSPSPHFRISHHTEITRPLPPSPSTPATRSTRHTDALLNFSRSCYILLRRECCSWTAASKSSLRSHRRSTTNIPNPLPVFCPSSAPPARKKDTTRFLVRYCPRSFYPQPPRQSQVRTMEEVICTCMR